MQDVRPASSALRGRGLDVARLAGIAAVVVVVAVVAWRAPAALRSVERQASDLAAMRVEQRDLLGARAADVDTRLFVEARRRIPTNATYAVVTGPNVEVSIPSTRDAVAPFSRYYLLPRRQVPYPASADWVLSFGGDLDALGLRFTERYSIAPGIDLARVAR